MRLENSFEVPGPPEAAWSLLLDVERIVPCMPGAELTEVVDESHWKAKLQVKLGPIALTFATDVVRERVDEDARRVTLSAKAREVRGRGGAQAQIESSLASSDGVTTATIVTDLTMSGAVGQYGRGIVQDVSSQLVGQFADCLAAQLAADAAAPAVDGNPPAPSRPARGAPARPVGAFRLVAPALAHALARALRRAADRLDRV